MFNCMILGSGRSGTSMAAGLLNNKKYFMGNDLIPPSPANPKGFFESSFINININEAILSKCKPKVARGHWWLTALDTSTIITSTPTIRSHIRRLVSKQPFCFKDPRFCYTVQLWRPFLPKNTKFVCIFRDPLATSTSMEKERQSAKYLRNLKFGKPDAFEVWYWMYRWILDIHSKKGDWIFISYENLLYGSGCNILSEFLDTSINTSFRDRKLDRSSKRIEVAELNDRISNTYKELISREKNV